MMRNLRINLAISLISGSILALQIVFTRLFSITIWHHFAYLVIGIALLGGGAAGVFLAVKGWTPAELATRVSSLALLFGTSIIVALVVVSSVEVDPLRRSQLLATIAGLVAYFLAMFTMYFVGGLTVASVFGAWGSDAHRLYFADLLGAGVGATAVFLLLRHLGAPALIILISLCAPIAALLFGMASKHNRLLVWGLGTTQVVLILWIIAFDSLSVSAPASKELGWALRTFGISKPEFTSWNPVARVDILPPVTIREPMIVGGVSSKYLEDIRHPNETFELRIVTLDGTSMTGIYRFDGDINRLQFLDYAIISAPYQVGLDRPSALLVGIGGGLDVLMARYYNSESITGIELNADLVRALREDYFDYGGGLAAHPRTSIVVAEGRSFLVRNRQQYDIIQGIGLDNLAALSGGAYVLAESYIYTVDALEAALGRLTPRGVFAWTRDSDSPPREMLRLTGTAAAALRRMGVAEPARHIAIVENETGKVATLLVARTPFSPDAVDQLRAWAARNSFRIQQDPLRRQATVYADYLHAPDPRAFEAAYPFNIFPVTDDNPFFYNYFLWKNVFSPDVWSTLNGIRLPIGNIILLTLVVMAGIASVLFVLIPLFRLQRESMVTPRSSRIVAYFCALGAAYIFLEIVLIQRMTLFVGYPTLAIAITIFAMLVFSALGSLVSQLLCTSPARLRITLVVLVGLIIIYGSFLPSILAALMMAEDWARMLLAVALIAPLAFWMGMPFPTGIRQLALTAPRLVPWAWGMNGVFSVLGSAVVIMVAMQANFTIATWLAAGGYLCAALLAGTLWRVHSIGEADAVMVHAPAMQSDKIG